MFADADGPPRRRRAGMGVLSSFIGLIYLALWPLDAIRARHPSTLLVVIWLVALASFVAAYVTLVALNDPWSGRSTRPVWITLGVITTMSVSYPAVLGHEWAGLPIYLTVAYAMALPTRLAPRGVLVGAVLTLVVCITTGVQGGSIALLTFESLTIGMLMLAFRGSRILVVQLREARDEVARLAASEERFRISRDLHDLLGHTLSLIVLKSEVAARLADRDPAKSLTEIGDIETVARRALADVREAISGYRRLSLKEEFDNAREVLAGADIEVTLRTQGTPLPAEIDGLFGWAVREGVTNIVRHSRARTVLIAVSCRGAEAVLEITDDGAGAGGGPGTGLTGLGERVAGAGGTVETGPGPDGGFRLTVRVPVATPE
jgi:two-component system, NarL family, sensor histidine kinase DesK